MPERVLVVAFHGWSDAGGAATTACDHLADALAVEPLHVISAEGYVDLQMYRPTITMNIEGERVLEWPDTQLYGPVAKPGAQTDPPRVKPLDGSPMPELFILDGTEPSQLWQMYADEVLDLAEAWSIDYVVMLGSMFSDAPHSRPIPITVTSEDAQLRTRFDARSPDYEGPVGISTIMTQTFAKAGLPSVSLWAQIPHYVHSSPSPKASLALLDRLEELLNIVIPRGTLLEEATDWEQNINKLASQDEDMTNYIERLEEARDSVEGPSATGDAIAYELEKFLRNDSEEN